MQTGRKRAVAAFALALSLSPAPTLAAASLETFLGDLQPVYDGIRKAMFYLERDAAAPAGFEIERSAEAWRVEVMPYSDSPPAAFAHDPRFGDTLEGIGEALARASAAEGAEASLDALSGIPATLAELRARNRVVVFADHVREANRAMDRLYAYRHRDIDFSDREVVDDLRARLAVTAYAYRECDAAAPTDVASDPAFRRMIDGTLRSLDLMWAAIAAGEQRTVINILREVRSFDRLLWLQHG